VGCGNVTLTYIFFYSFILVVGTTFLNLFIAVILDGYFQTVVAEEQVFNSLELENYQTKWSNFDSEATGFIDMSELPKLLFQLGKPLGWDKSFKNNKESQELFVEILIDSVKTYFGAQKLQFNVVLDNLIMVNVILTELQVELKAQNLDLNDD
jgi:hypothetical protein